MCVCARVLSHPPKGNLLWLRRGKNESKKGVSRNRSNLLWVTDEVTTGHMSVTPWALCAAPELEPNLQRCWREDVLRNRNVD